MLSIQDFSGKEIFNSIVGEKVLEARQRTLDSEYPNTLSAMTSLASSYSDVGRRQDAMELRDKVLAPNYVERLRIVALTSASPE